jgi:purine-nucleoside phosphorylase
MSATVAIKSKPSVEFVRADVAAKYIFTKTKLRPQIGIVLGSGLGAFADEIAGAVRIEYRNIPNFPRSTAIGHAGRMVIGKVADVPVAVMQGRVHLYEGYSPREVIFPMRVMARMGVRAVLLTNAAGGINTNFNQGCLVVLRDHINLQGTNPLIGPNDERFGERFPDMTQVYWKPYQAAALQEGKRLGIEIAEGVYAALSGPSYETPAARTL